MLESSKDLLFISLAFCAIIFTAFVCWFIYYMIAIVKNAYKITKSVQEKIALIDEILQAIKNKVNRAGNFLSVAITGLEKVVNYVQKKKEKQSSTDNEGDDEEETYSDDEDAEDQSSKRKKKR